MFGASRLDSKKSLNVAIKQNGCDLYFFLKRRAKMFGESDVYRQINNDANGVRPSNIKAPAVTWYMAFFVPNNVNFTEIDDVIKEKNIDNDEIFEELNNIVDHVNDRKFFKKRIDQFFIELCRGIRQQKQEDYIEISPKFDGKYILFNDFYDEISLNVLKIDQIDRNAKDDIVNIKDILTQAISNDYRSITANFMFKGLPASINCDLYGEYCSFSIIVELDSLKHDSSNAILKSHFLELVSAINGDDEQDMKKLSEFFYKTFWRNFSEYLAARCNMNIVTRTEAFKHIFADFRGVILPLEDDIRSSFQKNLASSFEEKPEIQFHSKEIWDGFLDFITNRDEFECTACHMLNKRILYMSDLAQRRNTVSIDRVPVTYLVCAKTENIKGPTNQRLTVKKWELGRAIDNIHQMGTVRLAALRDLDHIRESSRSLANLSAMMKQVSDTEKYERSNNNSLNIELEISVMRKARDYFNSINSKFIENDQSQQGLQYRIERSRFYVRQFLEKISKLQIDEIEGYQRYDHFVIGRMGTTFDFIDRVGQGHQRAGASLSLLEQAHLAENLNSATQKLANLAEKSDRTSKNIENLQEWADLALIGFLIPYYGYSMLKYLLPNVACSLNGGILIVWFLAYSVGSFRFSGLTKSISKEKIFVFIILTGGIILAISVYLIAFDRFAQFISDPIGWINKLEQTCVKH